jgi:hypothetical protein
MYGKQLHAYSYLLENPEEGSLSLGPITKLGLLYFTPDRYDQSEITRQNNCGWCRYRKLTGEVFSEEAQNPISPTCPDCDGPMRLRKGKYGEFWSCTKFPDCRGTRKL